MEQKLPRYIVWLEKVRRSIGYYLDLNRDKVANTETSESILSGIEFKGSTLWVLICAVFVASLGLNMNSIPVIIGAMLISPLMGPIMGMGMALAVHDGKLLRRCAKNLIVATLFALLTSCIYFLISPINDARSELLARTQPTIYDVLIAFFGGFAGIIATGSRIKGNVLPGVAIATALMPPLCTSGYGLATLQWNFFFGAFYLFLINCFYIGLATWVGVLILKLPKHVTLSPQRQKLMTRWVTALLIVMLVPCTFTTWNIVRKSIDERNVQMFVNTEFGEMPNTHVLNYGLVDTGADQVLEVTLIGESVDSVAIDEISSKLPLYQLADVRLKVMQGVGYRIDERQLSSTIMQGVVQMTRDELQAERALNDSLQQVVNAYTQREKETSELLPVLKVLFPKVAYIAISRSNIASVQDAQTIQTTMVVAYVNAKLTADETQKLTDWLRARQGTDSLLLIVKPVADLDMSSLQK